MSQKRNPRIIMVQDDASLPPAIHLPFPALKLSSKKRPSMIDIDDEDEDEGGVNVDNIVIKRPESIIRNKTNNAIMSGDAHNMHEPDGENKNMQVRSENKSSSPKSNQSTTVVSDHRQDTPRHDHAVIDGKKGKLDSVIASILALGNENQYLYGQLESYVPNGLFIQFTFYTKIAQN